MLKRMKIRFISSAMIAFGIVTLAVVLGIQLLNYYVTTARQDEILEGIMEYEQIRVSQSESPMPMISEMPWADGPEADFTTRFFAVHCDEEKNIENIFTEHIASINSDTVCRYTEKILEKGDARGNCDNYRYMKKNDDEGTTIVFLDISREQRFMRSLIRVSVVIALAGLLAVFFLILLFSGKAIRPYAKNMERQKQFITDAGHELKTPLTSIATSADILAMEHEGDEWIENIRKQTARLSVLVKKLVALSRLDEEMPFPEKTEFSLSDAAWETAEPFVSLAAAAGKQYTQHIEENLRLVGDRSSIQQMLSILLDNAVRYSDEGGKIRLDIFRKHNKIQIEVFNTCELMDVTDLNRLFDRFYRPDKSRSAHTGGTGIGLSLAKAIAETHGGKISAGSRDGKSILFKVLV